GPELLFILRVEMLKHRSGPAPTEVLATRERTRRLADLDNPQSPLVAPPQLALGRIEYRTLRDVGFRVDLPLRHRGVGIKADHRPTEIEVGRGSHRRDLVVLVEHDPNPLPVPRVVFTGLRIESRGLVAG